MSTTFTIDLDVSRALAAQQKILDKFDQFSKKGSEIGATLEPLRTSFASVDSSLSNLTKGSLSNLERQLRKVVDAGKELASLKKIDIGYSDLNNLRTSESAIRNITEALRVLKSGMRDMPSFRFDTASVGQYQEKIKALQTSMQQLQYLKPALSPVDSANFERSVKNAIDKAKQELRVLTNSKDANGFLRIDTSEFDKQIDYVRNKALTVFTIKSKGSISGKEIAESMGFGDDLTNRITKTINHIESENKRLGISLKTSIVGDATPSNKMSSLIASTTRQLESTLGPAVIRHGEIWKSMGLDIDRSGEAMRAMPDKAFKVATSIDASAEAYKRETAALTEATRAQMSFYEGMVKLANYTTATKIPSRYTDQMSHTAVIPHSDVFKSMGFGDDLTRRATEAMPIVNQLAGHVDTVGKKATEAQSKLSGLGLVIKRVFEYGLVYRFQNALMSLPGQFYDINASLEKMRTTYEGVFGNNSSSEFDYAAKAAQTYGKSIESIGDSYKKFTINTEFLGMAQENSRHIFESVTQALTKVGASSSDVQNAFRAVEQMLSKGTVSAEEFRRQFAQYIPGAMKLGADAVGKTTAEFMKMMKNGELISLEFLPKFADQLAMFATGWEKAADTIEANSERLKNSLSLWAESSGFQKGIKNTLSALDKLVSKANEAHTRLNMMSENDDLVKQGMVKDGRFNLSDGTFDYEGFSKFKKELSDTSVEGQINRIKTALYGLRKEKAELDKQWSTATDSNFEDLEKKSEANSYGISKNEEKLVNLDSQRVFEDVAKIKAAISSLQNLPKEGEEFDFRVNEEKLKWYVDYLKEQLPEAIANARSLAEKGIDIEVNKKRAEEAEALLKQITAGNWNALLVVHADTNELDAAIAKFNKFMATTAAGKLDNAKDTLTTGNNAINAIEAKMMNTKSAHEYNELQKERVKTLDAVAQAEAQVAKAQRDVYKQNEKQIELDKKYGNSVGVHAKFGEYSKENKASMERDAGSTAAWKEFDKSEKKPEDWKKLSSAVAGFNENYTEYVKQLNKKEGGGGHKEERHANAVDKLTGSLDNLLRKEMGLAEEAPLTAAFAAADEKLNTLMKNIKNLALDGGFNIDEATKRAKEMHTELLKIATDKQLENIFPWLKQDDAIKAVADVINKFYHGTKEESKVVAESLAKEGMEITDVTKRWEKLSKLAPNLKELAKAEREMSEATNFGEYHTANTKAEKLKTSSGGADEHAAIKEVSDFFIVTSQQMRDSRIEMYKRIAEQAKAYGMDSAKAEAFVRAKMEETEVARLEALQKYGTASEAFAARMAQNYEVYKSAETKSRESAVKMADSIKGATDSMASGIGQSIGDIIRNMADGTASIEDIWKTMLGRITDMVANFVENLITDKLKNVFNDLVGGMFSDGSTASKDSVAPKVADNFVQSSFTTASFTGAVFSGTIGSGGAGTNSVTSSSSSSNVFEQATSNTSNGGFDSSTINKLGDAIGSKSGSTFTDTVTGGTDVLSFDIGNTMDIGEDFTKAISKSTSYGDVWNASAPVKDVWNAGSYVGKTSSSASSMLGTIGGYAGAGLGGAGLGAGVSSMLGGNSTIGTIGGAIGGLAGFAIAGPVGGLVGGLIGGLAGAFDTSKKEEKKKVASGYNVGYSSGHATSYGVDFYNDGSVNATGASDPDVQKKIADAFKDTAENLQDFAEELGFAVDVLEGFEFPNMNVTSDQLDGYIRNGENQMAFKGLMEAGLRGAFDAVAEDGEVYVDEYERLATSLKAVKGSFEAYGYDMQTVAQITQEQIDNLRAKNTEVAEGTADAMKAMATSMGAGADTIAQITSETTHASAALSVTDEQLSNILEADYSSKLLDAVGGEDAFKSIMGNLTKNIFDTIDAYAENLEYYNEKAQTSIAKLGDATVTVDNFWTKFDEAIKEGLTVDEFEAWGKASDWVNQIDTVNQAISDWNDGMTKLNQNLDQRTQAANGLDYEASLTKQMADAEWELAEARKANYDASYIARLQEVQALELEATKRKHAEDYRNELWDAQGRIYSATGNNAGTWALQMKKNDADLMELSKKYNWSSGSSEEQLFVTLQDAQAAELFNTIKDSADKVASAIASLNLETREAKLAGNSNLAEALSMISSFTSEYKNALEAGVDQATLDRLMSVQQAELAQYWASVDSSLGTVVKTLEELKDIILNKFNAFISTQLETLQAAKDDASSKASSYDSARKSIADTLTSWATDDDPTRNAQQTFLNAQSIFNNAYTKAMGGDVEALGNISSYASTYKEAGQGYFGSVDDYATFYRGLISKMRELEDVAKTKYDEQDYLANMYQVQIDLYELLRDSLAEDDPNTAKLEAIATAIGLTNNAIETGNDSTSVLQSLTSSGNGGYADIVAAITQKTSLPNTYLDTLVSKQTVLNSLMAQFLGVQQKNALQSQVDAAKTEYLAYYNNAKTGFQTSGYGQYIQAIANSGYGWEGAIGNLTTTGYGFTNGARYVDWAMAGNQTPSALGSWFLNNYGAGTGYVNWDSAMTQWLSSYGSLPSGSSSNYSSYLSSYQTYQSLLAQLQALGGFADGGISTGAQLAWVSEGSYATEAHVPLPDGRTIPVTVTSDGSSEAVSALREEIAILRAEIKAANIQLINYAKTNADYVKKCDAIGTPTVRKEA